MYDKEQRYYDGRNKVGSGELAQYKPDRIALIESVEEIGAAPKVKHPDRGNP